MISAKKNKNEGIKKIEAVGQFLEDYLYQHPLHLLKGYPDGLMSLSETPLDENTRLNKRLRIGVFLLISEQMCCFEAVEGRKRI